MASSHRSILPQADFSFPREHSTGIGGLLIRQLLQSGGYKGVTKSFLVEVFGLLVTLGRMWMVYDLTQPAGMVTLLTPSTGGFQKRCLWNVTQGWLQISTTRTISTCPPILIQLSRTTIQIIMCAASTTCCLHQHASLSATRANHGHLRIGPTALDRPATRANHGHPGIGPTALDRPCLSVTKG